MFKVKNIGLAHKELSPSNKSQVTLDFIDLTNLDCSANQFNIDKFKDIYYNASDDDLSILSEEDYYFPLTAYQVNSNYDRSKMETHLKKKITKKNRLNKACEKSKENSEGAKNFTQYISRNDLLNNTQNDLISPNNSVNSAPKKCVKKTVLKSNTKANLGTLSSSPTNLCFTIDDDDDCILVDENYVIQHEEKIKSSPVHYQSDTEAPSTINTSEMVTAHPSTSSETIYCDWAMQSSDNDTDELPSLSPLPIDASEILKEKTASKNSKLPTKSRKTLKHQDKTNQTTSSCISPSPITNTVNKVPTRNKASKTVKQTSKTKITSKKPKTPQSVTKMTNKKTGKSRSVTKNNENAEKPHYVKKLNMNTDEAVSVQSKDVEKQIMQSNHHDIELNDRKKVKNLFPVRRTKIKPLICVDYENMPNKRMQQIKEVGGTSTSEKEKSRINDKPKVKVTSQKNMKPQKKSSNAGVQDSLRPVNNQDLSNVNQYHQDISFDLPIIDHDLASVDHDHSAVVNQYPYTVGQYQHSSNVNKSLPACINNKTNSARRHSSEGEIRRPFVNRENRDSSVLIAEATKRLHYLPYESSVNNLVSHPAVEGNMANLRMTNQDERQKNVMYSGSVGSNISHVSRVNNSRLVEASVGEQNIPAIGKNRRASVGLDYTAFSSREKSVESSLTRVDMNLNNLPPSCPVAIAMPGTESALLKPPISHSQIDVRFFLENLKLINLSSKHLGCLESAFQSIITRVNLSEQNSKENLLDFLTKCDTMQLLQSCIQILRCTDQQSLSEEEIMHIELSISGLEKLVRELKKKSREGQGIDINKFAHATSQRKNSEILMLMERLFIYKNYEKPDQNELTNLCKSVVSIQVESLINGDKTFSTAVENDSAISSTVLETSKNLWSNFENKNQNENFMQASNRNAVQSNILPYSFCSDIANPSSDSNLATTSSNSLCDYNDTMRALNIPVARSSNTLKVPSIPVAYNHSMRVQNNPVPYSTTTTMRIPNNQVTFNNLETYTPYNSTMKVNNNNILNTINSNITRITDSVQAKATSSYHSSNIQKSQLSLKQEDLEKLVDSFHNLYKDSQIAVMNYLTCLEVTKPLYVKTLRQRLSRM